MQNPGGSAALPASDPLQLIRQATMTRSAVTYSDGYYIFGKQKFHQSTKTAFKRSHQGGGHYTLRDIIFFLEHADGGFREYRQAAIKAGVNAVIATDTKNLRDYLMGTIDTCEQIDAQKLIAAAGPASTAAVAVAALTEEQSQSLLKFRGDAKRRRLEDFAAHGAPAGSSAAAASASASTTASATDFPSADFVALDRLQLASIRADEYPAKTGITLLRGNSDVDFSFALKLFQEQVLRPDRPEAAAENTNGRSSSSSSGRGVPIIIVPNSTASCISILNAADFLVEGAFVSSEQKKMDGMRREAEVVIKRTDPSTGESREYKIIDNPTTLRPEDWDRVVAVFVSGQLWQFKGWKWAQPVDLFRQVLGVYLTFDDRAVDTNVQSWNCKIIKISQSQRHLDASRSLAFWAYLDNYIKLYRPGLLKKN